MTSERPYHPEYINGLRKAAKVLRYYSREWAKRSRSFKTNTCAAIAAGVCSRELRSLAADIDYGAKVLRDESTP